MTTKMIFPPRYQQVLYQTLVSNKLVHSQAKQSIPTDKTASKQQEQFDSLEGNQVSQGYTPFSPP